MGTAPHATRDTTTRAVTVVGIVTALGAMVSPQAASGLDTRPSLILAVALAAVSIVCLTVTVRRHPVGVRIVLAILLAVDLYVVWECTGWLGWRGAA